MNQQEGCASNKAPILNKEGYALWSIRMRVYLQSLGYGVRNSVIFDYIPPQRVRTTSQKEYKKNKSREIETIIDGLHQPIKENIGLCISTKDLEVKLKKLYSVKEIVEVISTILKDKEKVSVHKSCINIYG